MIQSDVDIKEMIDAGELSVERESGREPHIGVGSIDLHLKPGLKKPVATRNMVDVSREDTYPRFVETEKMYLEPGRFALGCVDEKIVLPENLSGFIWGRSSVGRLGLFVHNAGFTDPGFSGQLVLELVNAAPYPISLKPDMRICQITIHEYETPPTESYGVDGKYQNQMGIRESELWRDFDATE